MNKLLWFKNQIKLNSDETIHFEEFKTTKLDELKNKDVLTLDDLKTLIEL